MKAAGNKYCWGRYLIFCIMILLMACSVYAQEQAPDAEEEQQAEVLTAVQQRMQQRISVDFRETPIEDVLRILAKQADVDIVKSPEVVGNVTATLTDIPLSEALDNILSAHGYGYIPTENMIRVVPRKDIVDIREKLVNRIYRINYADVKEVERALQKFISKSGSLSSNPGTSNIIVTDAESKIEAIDAFIEEVDRITPQVLVEVRIYDVTSSDDFELNLDWTVARNVEVKTTERVKTSGADTTTTNVVDGVITETQALGSSDSKTTTSTTGRHQPFIAGDYDKESGGTFAFALLNDAVALEFTLQTLHDQGNAKLLASPRLLVLDNETASFQIIEEIPYKEETSTSGGGQLTSTQFKDVGVLLEVTPHVTRDEMLRMHIIPEFSVSQEQLRNPITNEPIVPTVNSRKLNTITLLKNGQTVVLAGLKQSKVTRDYWKTPLLADLPFIGDFFKSETESLEITELIVFITPKIIHEATLSPREAEILPKTEIPVPREPELSRFEQYYE